MNLDGSLKITVMEHNWMLLPEKALFWRDQNTLVVSDLHLGKSGHFRKHGIAIPQSVNTSNIQKLNKLIRQLKPARIIFLGDLFHSQYNAEFEDFKDWRKANAEIEMILTLGNHDIISQHEFEKTGLECVNTYKVGPFTFMHDEQDAADKGSFSVSGHIHPAVKLKTKGRQSIYTPCYFVGESKILLPAFGTFTGTFLVKPSQNEMIYAIVDQEVINISTII
ncbi:ligase-associated DNA damage response endonuclease PdeM [Gracilimonas sp. Q87]|uniref:ligase-associated DNA damage response endonuclease PdeM n=1 Tax=Gracilimonas sp. Q87 TaxID=3384766 RepID=UPI0039843261